MRTYDAAFGSALWRTLPYYGRLFITHTHICFHSKVLAGRQRVSGLTKILGLHRGI